MQETTFGNYQLIEMLGRGGMGEVWRAHDTVIDRTVAIKILPAEISRDADYQERFRREARAAARLNSPHIVPVHTHGEIDGRLFVDMKLVEGRDLQSILDQGPLPPARAVNIIEQIAKALNAAHKVKLLHRDVKPSNILIDDEDDDYAYLIDFGIALAVGDRGLTTVGDVIGTFHYMAPERFKSQDPGTPPVDARSDIYALACVLYECLTAEHAFRGDSLEQQIGNHLVTPPPRPSATNPALRGFDNVIAKGMAKNPADRYSTAVELARAARGAVTAPMPLPRPPEPRPPAWRPTPPRPPMPQPPAEYGRRPVSAPHHTGPDTFRQPALDSNSYPRREPLVVQPPVTPPSPPHTPSPTPATPALPSPPWWRRKAAIIAGAAVLAVAVVVVVMTVFGGSPPPPDNPDQRTLPFSGITVAGLAVDNAGTVYVGDTQNNKVWALHAGADRPDPLSFQGLRLPTGVTVDNSGNVYVNDAGNKRVVKLNVDRTQTVLPAFNGLESLKGLAVDSAGRVYVTDAKNNKVYSSEPDSDTKVDVGINGLLNPSGLAVGPEGSLYVADTGNNRVVQYKPASKQTIKLPVQGLSDPGGVAVDNANAVYVTDTKDNRVLKLPAGAGAPDELHFTGLEQPWGLAVDNNGTVYAASTNNKVVALQQKK